MSSNIKLSKPQIFLVGATAALAGCELPELKDLPDLSSEHAICSTESATGISHVPELTNVDFVCEIAPLVRNHTNQLLGLESAPARTPQPVHFVTFDEYQVVDTAVNDGNHIQNRAVTYYMVSPREFPAFIVPQDSEWKSRQLTAHEETHQYIRERLPKFERLPFCLQEGIPEIIAFRCMEELGYVTGANEPNRSTDYVLTKLLLEQNTFPTALQILNGIVINVGDSFSIPFTYSLSSTFVEFLSQTPQGNVFLSGLKDLPDDFRFHQAMIDLFNSCWDSEDVDSQFRQFVTNLVPQWDLSSGNIDLKPQSTFLQYANPEYDAKCTKLDIRFRDFYILGGGLSFPRQDQGRAFLEIGRSTGENKKVLEIAFERDVNGWSLIVSEKGAEKAEIYRSSIGTVSPEIIFDIAVDSNTQEITVQIGPEFSTTIPVPEGYDLATPFSFGTAVGQSSQWQSFVWTPR